MIRRCRDTETAVIWEIINDGATAYEGVIPDDRLHDPYMTLDELQHEIEDGVDFWGLEENGVLQGVMGIQDRGDVALIRHSYVRTSRRNKGFGTRLLRFLESTTTKPILVGTWAAAWWAVAFYQKNGYRLVGPGEKDSLLSKYWTISERQRETSVVLARLPRANR